MKIKIKYFKTFNFLGLIVLSACSNYSNDFDCAVGEGMHCSSLSRVNKAIDHKLIDIDDHIEDLYLNHKPENIKTTSTSTFNYQPQAPVTVWIAPRFDEQGVLYESQTMRFD